MINTLKNQLKSYFVGKDEVVDYLLICLFAGGHILLEDVPGVGKTTLAKVLSKSIDCDFARIQFTPDTLPGDIVGTEIYNMKTGEFECREGAIMHQIILADEINRTSPKTQAALLEAMAEGQVTIGDKAFTLPSPFMVIATQNPVEFVGTYLLPEAQLDRFMMKISIGYPSESEEIRMVKNAILGSKVDEINSVCSSENIINIRKEVQKVTVNESMIKYIREIVDLTRNEPNFVLGASPRALIDVVKASQARAYMCGRDFVKPDDVKFVASSTLHHRIVLTSDAKIRKESVQRVLEQLIVKAKIPM